jgi:hypothetical protein
MPAQTALFPADRLAGWAAVAAGRLVVVILAQPADLGRAGVGRLLWRFSWLAGEDDYAEGNWDAPRQCGNQGHQLERRSQNNGL